MNILKPSFVWNDTVTPDGNRMIANIARAGRICYLSDKTKDDGDFIRARIREGHESILEHEKLSVIITCDRGITHETVRHRIASYSQESTRYCNYGKKGGGINYIDITGGILRDPKCSKLSPEIQAMIIQEWIDACMDAERHYLKMLELGASPQIARSVLNNSTKAAIVITMNLREWRHFFSLRANFRAHPQMIEVADMLLVAFQDVVPVVFEDLGVGYVV